MFPFSPSVSLSVLIFLVGLAANKDVGPGEHEYAKGDFTGLYVGQQGSLTLLRNPRLQASGSATMGGDMAGPYVYFVS